MRETRTMEFKETITNTFLKTVSAFSNYDGGVILFGVDDEGNSKGLSDVKQSCLDIENKINDSISPQPDYKLETQNNDKIIKLTVQSGAQKPYLYRSKAYKRNDTATIEVDTQEFSRLVLEGKNIRFEELPCKDQNLTFQILQRKLKEHIQIETFSQDTLKTLNLYDNANGYNNAAGLLADQNHFPGIDMVRFGENISIIQKRVTFENRSILEVYEKAIEIFRDYYQYEEIKGADRKKIEKIPEAAFREAIANGLIHRIWDVESQIRVLMFEDRIEVVSPGGLPAGITKEEYLSGKLSVLRNRNLANVFYRLQLIEAYGTGIRKILNAYHDVKQKPGIQHTQNAFKIILPNRNQSLERKEEYEVLSKTEQQIIELMKQNGKLSRKEIETKLELSTSTALRLLKKLTEKNLVVQNREGRKVNYHLIEN